jgi:hypothetical protein
MDFSVCCCSILRIRKFQVYCKYVKCFYNELLPEHLHYNFITETQTFKKLCTKSTNLEHC